jgi:hypothetical protein
MVDVTAELHNRRLSWMLCGILVRSTATRSTPFSWFSVLIWSFLSLVVVLPLSIMLLGAAGWFVAAPVSLLVTPTIYALVVIFGSAWWATGAGYPVLVVRNGQVHGRLRPVWSDEIHTADPDDPSWWDFQLPASELLGVRIVRSERKRSHHLLALDLPPRLRDALLESDDLNKVTGRLNRDTGTPAAWSIGHMYPPGRRSAGVKRLTRALHQAGAPS